MRRSMEPIVGVKPEELDNYSPVYFGAKLQPDGTYTLVPVRWVTQREYEDYQYGCGWDDY